MFFHLHRLRDNSSRINLLASLNFLQRLLTLRVLLLLQFFESNLRLGLVINRMRELFLLLVHLRIYRALLPC